MLSQIPLSLMRRWILFCVLLASSALSIKATRSPKSNFIAPGSPSCCSYALNAAGSFKSLNTFAKGFQLNKTKRGDLIALRSAGAYGEIMASQYNLRRLPKAYTSDELK
jgi:hypothetical protein